MPDAETQEDLETELLAITIDIAKNAPARRGTYASHAKVYWPLIEDLRRTLDQLGIRWRGPDA